jgi:hypothetical protein
MNDRTTAGTGDTFRRQTGIHERVIFAAPCYEKKESFRHIPYSMILLTPERLIVIPFPLARLQPAKTDKEPDQIFRKIGDSARTRDSSLITSLDSRSGEYLEREADEILTREKDALVISLEDIGEIIIRRVRRDSRSSRWLSVLFALYPLEPAGARYSVDYQLTITTPGREYVLITPFSLPLKQVLVDYLGSRVHEIIDDYAPLL